MKALFYGFVVLALLGFTLFGGGIAAALGIAWHGCTVYALGCWAAWVLLAVAATCLAGEFFAQWWHGSFWARLRGGWREAIREIFR